MALNVRPSVYIFSSFPEGDDLIKPYSMSVRPYTFFPFDLDETWYVIRSR